MIANIVKRLLRHTGGSAAVLLGVGLIPTMFVGYGALQVSDYVTISTRLSQSHVAALYAVGKGGPDAVSSGGRQGLAWMRTNADFLRRGDITHSFTPPAGEGDYGTAESDISASLLPNILPGVPGREVTRARFAYLPLELALAFPATNNASFASPPTDMVEKIVDAAYLGDASRDDVWISLVFAASFVNIGTAYADKLVTYASRVPYYDEQDYISPIPADSIFLGGGPETDREKIRILHEKTRTMLRNNYPALASNLLSFELPGYDLEGGGVICVHRQMLGHYEGDYEKSPIRQPETGGARIREYVESAFTAPRSPAEGFDLVQGLPMLPGSGFHQRLYKSGTNLWISQPSGFLGWTSLYDQAVGYRGVRLAQVLKTIKNYDSNLFNNRIRFERIQNALMSTSWTSWSSDIRFNLEDAYQEPVITIPGGCPRTAMLVGEQDREAIIERVQYYWGAAYYKAQDVALAWALRALSPGYESIWNKSDYPAPYTVDGGEREKRVLFIADDDIAGPYVEEDVVAEMCRGARERGIEIFLLTEESVRLSSEAEAVFDACADTEHRIRYSSMAALPDALAPLAARKFRTRLVGVD